MLLGSGRKNGVDELADSIPVIAHNQSPYVWLQTRQQRDQNSAENSGDFVMSQRRQGALKLASITYILCLSFPKHYFRELAKRNLPLKHS